MKYLFFDTETTGLPMDYKAPATDSENWPRMIQFGYVVNDENARELDRGSFIVKPEGFAVSEKAARLNGITTERALAEGIPYDEAMKRISKLLEDTDVLVGHNVGFDINIVDAEFWRYNRTLPMENMDSVCTMKASTNFCNLPNNKWPKLIELHQILFGKGFKGAHDALADISATRDCFWKLRELGVIGGKPEATADSTNRSEARTDFKAGNTGCMAALALITSGMGTLAFLLALIL